VMHHGATALLLITVYLLACHTRTLTGLPQLVGTSALDR